MRTTTDGIVIGTHNIDECDRVLCILTSGMGIVRAYARGARRPGSKLSGSTELLSYSRFVLFEYKDRLTVDSADTNAQFFEIRQDIEKLALASYLCELCADTAPAGAGAMGGEHLRLLLNSLAMLGSGRRAPAFLKPLYELRQVSLSGYMPNLVGCDECGCYESDWFHFYPLTGKIVCKNCDKAPKAGQYTLLSPSLTAAMRHILYADMTKLFSFSLPPERLSELSAVCERYVKAQLSRTFKSLEFYHSLTF